VQNGHSWLDVQKYSLSEVGTFLRVILKQEAMDRADSLSIAWMGHNLSKEGYAKTIEDMVSSVRPKKAQQGPTPTEVHSEWKRLASFMNGRK